MLDQIKPVEGGLYDHRPLGLHPRLIRCEDPEQVLRLLEDATADRDGDLFDRLESAQDARREAAAALKEWEESPNADALGRLRGALETLRSDLNEIENRL